MLANSIQLRIVEMAKSLKLDHRLHKARNVLSRSTASNFLANFRAFFFNF